MIPTLTRIATPARLYRDFIDKLSASAFEGDLSIAAADRVVLSTDNSIYQIQPQAIAFPANQADLVRIASLAATATFRDIAFRPRGGGTGTNGQSLGDGLVVDLSRHMTRILEINPQEGWVRVEAGVVKDELEAALDSYGLFFPPELSTSDRATIGGMISTDACGQGSCLYGKTRDYVLELTTVLHDGTVLRSHEVEQCVLDELLTRDGIVGAVHRVAEDIQRTKAALIKERFPPLNRCLTGYDLAHLRGDNGNFNLNSLLCGSEGTLGFIAEAKLKVRRKPAVSILLNVCYANFDAALRDAATLMKVRPASIETIDSKVLELAQGDSIWRKVAGYFPHEVDDRVLGVNFVEFCGDDPIRVEAEVERAIAVVSSSQPNCARLGFRVVRGSGVDAIWAMRKKAVGLLGNISGNRRPVPFVEDTAVPPERLADYIGEFRAILDRHMLDYGMFGHVDAGVLHVRPCLDLTDPRLDHIVREVTDEIVALTKKYGGLLWGEHGKGVRSEFVPEFFGPLYPSLVAIKSVFDPFNQYNPGKIASPDATPLMRVDATPRRGEYDREISGAVRGAWGEAMHCNGNGACFNWDPDDTMCPSWKATRDRRHSPKGRASLVREWLRQLSATGIDPITESRRIRSMSLPSKLMRGLRHWWRGHDNSGDFSHAVKEALDGCLACKACSATCPIKVDVPSMRARFLELYHDRYPRPLKDIILAGLEPLAPWIARAPRFYNFMVCGRAGRAVLRWLGVVYSPRLSEINLARELRSRGIQRATPKALKGLAAADRLRSVVLVQDAFTSHFDASLVLSFADLLQELGFRPWVAPFRANGKPLHVIGMLGAFERVAARNAAALCELSDQGVDLVGIDPSMTLSYRYEYRQVLGAAKAPIVHLIQEWMAFRCRRVPQFSGSVSLLPHCTERTNAASSIDDWNQVFETFGLRLKIVPAGCCGMAGAYGHNAEQRSVSEQIYALSWASQVSDSEPNELMATGYSCRSQVKLISGTTLRHPVQVLLSRLRAGR